MTFTFIHTADWQIGKRFGAFGAEKAAVLREARLTALDKISQTALEAGARHILVAGDVFDVETPGERTLRQPFEKMRGHDTLTWHLLPGNHDPARPGGLWDHVARLSVPQNVRVFLRPQPVEIEQGVYVLPAPLTNKAPAKDPTAWISDAATPQGALRIGLAHGSVQDFSDTPGAGARLDPRRAKQAGLDYLALGDWHGVQQIDERCWYSGTPEPDRWPDNDPGHVLAVTLEGEGAPPKVRPVSTATYIWRKLRMPVGKEFSIAALRDSVLSLQHSPGRTLVHLALQGMISLGGHQRLTRMLAELDAALFHLRLDWSDLHVRPGSADLNNLAKAGELRETADRLRQIAEDETAPERRAAEDALALLFAWTQTDDEISDGGTDEAVTS